MEMQQPIDETNLTRKDLYIIGLAFLGLIFVTLLLYDDHILFRNIYQGLGNHKAVAVVSHHVNDVRRRVDTDIVWLPLLRNDNVYEADTIYTGLKSEAEVTLLSGVQIQLEPESLVVIHGEKIDLQRGHLWAKIENQSQVEISTPYFSGKVTGKGGVLRIDAGKKDNPVELAEGEANVDDGSGAKELVKPGLKRYDFSFNNLSAPTLVHPNQRGIIQVNNKEPRPISFQWATGEPLSLYKIQVSSDPSFKSTVWEGETSEEALLSKPLELGRYFWRVQGGSTQKMSQWSQVGSFEIDPIVSAPKKVEPPPKTLRAPKIQRTHQTFKIESYHPSGRSIFQKMMSFVLPRAEAQTEQIDKPKLTWEKLPDAKKYEVEVAKDKSFETVFVKGVFDKNSVAWKSHRPGTFYWHVRGIDQDGHPGEYSQVASFDLVLVSPKVHKAEPTKGDPEKVTLSWNRVSYAKGYEVQFSPDREFANPTILEVKGTSLETTIPPGAKFWRVRAITVPPKYNGKFSKAQSFDRSDTQTTLGPVQSIALKPLEKRPGRPILFDPADNGVEVEAPLFEYEVSHGGEIRVGETSPINLNFALTLDKKEKPTFSFGWPQGILKSGRMTLMTADEKTVFEKFDISQDKVSISNGLAHVDRTVSLEAMKKVGPVLDLKFCGEQERTELNNKFCSRIFTCDLGQKECHPQESKKGGSLSVRINGTEAPLQGNFPSKIGEKIAFEVKDKDDAFVSLETQSKDFKVRDVVMQDEQIMVVSGNGALPVSDKNSEVDGFNWRTAVLLTRPTIYFYGANDVAFKVALHVHGQLPYEKDRGYIKFESPQSTYLEEVKLKGFSVSPSHDVSSTQREAHSLTNQDFEWDFVTPERGNANIDKISWLEGKDKVLKGRYGVYRGYNYEVGARCSAVFTDSNRPLILAEGVGSAWFEKPFKCENPSLCYQRWGVAAKYSNTLVSTTNTAGNSVSLSGLNADLKYRLTPGVQNQDETFGLLLGYQTITYSGASANMLGVGGFWTKAMPSFADKVLNYIKWFRYPKVLEVELQYYPISTQSSVSLGLTYNLMFKGKIFIKHNLFFEGGVSFRQYYYTLANQSQVQTGLAFVSAGVGYNF